MSNLLNLITGDTKKVQSARNKVSDFLQSGNDKSAGSINPLLNKKGGLVNPYIDYQSVLDSGRASTQAMDFIQRATGLSPNPAAKPVDVTTPAVPNTTQNESSLVQAAKNYIGTPYVWGGESISEGGMDCSGFVYNALKDAGYNIGRTTAQGYRSYGDSVSKSDMQPGDLVFFGKDGRASHIGIYIGNGQMIHSSGGNKNTKNNPGKGVSIANVDYRSDFIEARRF